MALHVAVVTRDPELRERAARCFDDAPVDWRVTLEDVPPAGADVVVTGPEVAVAGDVVFDGATDLLGAVRSAVSDRPGRVIRVGGLPGSGRTSVAVHLAAALARRRSVCLIDRDPAGAIAHRLLIDGPRRFAVGDRVREAAIPIRGGLRLLTPADPGTDVVGAAAGSFEVLVVDGEPAAACDIVVLQPTLPQARRLAASLGDARPPCIVTNRLGRGGGKTRCELERVLGRRIALQLPHAPALRDAEDHGHLVPKWTRWWNGIALIAGSVAP